MNNARGCLTPDAVPFEGTAATAKWLGISERQLMKSCRGRKPRIPAVWITQKIVKFHRPTIIAKFAADAGVDPEVIAKSFNTPQ